MRSFVVGRMLEKDGISVARTESFGSVDIRSPERDTPIERQMLHVSCKKFGEIQDDVSAMRIVTVVTADNIHAADNIAAERFEEVANIRSTQTVGISRIKVMQAGYFRTIGGGATPRDPPMRPSPGIHFRITSSFFEPIDFGRWLYVNQRTDLAQRLIRSFHWSHRAQLESNRQLRVLFRWFAMETIWTLRPDDDVTPRILWALGVPNGKGLLLMSRDRMERLHGHPRYGYWKKELERVAKEIKVFRNETVHTGFRAQDKTIEQIYTFDRVARLACDGVQHQTELGLRSGIGTAEELLENLPILLDTDDYVDDIAGNILFALENRNRYRDQ